MPDFDSLGGTAGFEPTADDRTDVHRGEIQWLIDDDDPFDWLLLIGVHR